MENTNTITITEEDYKDFKKALLTFEELNDELCKLANVEVPNAIEEIRSAQIRHNNICEVDEMQQVVKNFLGM